MAGQPVEWQAEEFARAYGWTEAPIGLAAPVFHQLFTRCLTDVSLGQVIPAVGSPEAVEIYKYTLCAVRIVPQTGFWE